MSYISDISKNEKVVVPETCPQCKASLWNRVIDIEARVSLGADVNEEDGTIDDVYIRDHLEDVDSGIFISALCPECGVTLIDGGDR